MACECRETAGSVAAHFGFPAICIIIPHAHICLNLRRLDGDEPICPDAETSVAQPGNVFPCQDVTEGEVAVIDHDEVISGSGHFVERNNHCWLVVGVQFCLLVVGMRCLWYS